MPTHRSAPGGIVEAKTVKTNKHHVKSAPVKKTPSPAKHKTSTTGDVSFGSGAASTCAASGQSCAGNAMKPVTCCTGLACGINPLQVALGPRCMPPGTTGMGH